MRAFSRPITTTATSLAELTGSDVHRPDGVGLQAPEGNAAIIYFGDHASQPFELRPKANVFIPVHQTKDVFVKGTPGDVITIGFF